MKAIWRQNARPRLKLVRPSTASTTSTTGTLGRRTTTIPLRKRLTFNDAFTILLAPVLATAVIADTSWKDKKRKDWDAKIANIQKEIEQLQAREVEAWVSLQMRSTITSPVYQRRMYSTAARAMMVEQLEELGDEELDVSPKSQDTRVDIQQVFEPNDHEIHALYRLERLVAVRLAVELILHLHTGKSARFSGLSNTYLLKDTEQSVDVGTLISRLQDLNCQIRDLHPSNVLRQVALRPRKTPERAKLDAKIADLIRQSEENQMSDAKRVEEFAVQILQSNEAPTALSYKGILKLCSRSKFPDLTQLIINAMSVSRMPIDDEAVSVILTNFGKWKDVYRAEDLYKQLTSLNGRYNFVNRWEWRDHAGCAIAMPVHSSPQLLQVLTFASLRFKQLEKAEAYASLLEQADGHGPQYHHVLRQFLHLYTHERNWGRGKIWLAKCKAVLASLPLDSQVLGRIVQRMLDFCVACGHRDEYRKILTAAIDAGIQRPVEDQRVSIRLADRVQAILREWSRLFSEKWSQSWSGFTAMQSARAFVKFLNDSNLQDWERTADTARPPQHKPGDLDDMDCTGPDATAYALELNWRQKFDEHRSLIQELTHGLRKAQAELRELRQQQNVPNESRQMTEGVSRGEHLQPQHYPNRGTSHNEAQSHLLDKSTQSNENPEETALSTKLIAIPPAGSKDEQPLTNSSAGSANSQRKTAPLKVTRLGEPLTTTAEGRLQKFTTSPITKPNGRPYQSSSNVLLKAQDLTERQLRI